MPASFRIEPASYDFGHVHTNGLAHAEWGDLTVYNDGGEAGEATVLTTGDGYSCWLGPMVIEPGSYQAFPIRFTFGTLAEGVHTGTAYIDGMDSCDLSIDFEVWYSTGAAGAIEDGFGIWTGDVAPPDGSRVSINHLMTASTSPTWADIRFATGETGGQIEALDSITITITNAPVWNETQSAADPPVFRVDGAGKTLTVAADWTNDPNRCALGVLATNGANVHWIGNIQTQWAFEIHDGTLTIDGNIDTGIYQPHIADMPGSSIAIVNGDIVVRPGSVGAGCVFNGVVSATQSVAITGAVTFDAGAENLLATNIPTVTINGVRWPAVASKSKSRSHLWGGFL